MLKTPTIQYKFVLVGDSAVGKSSLLNRFVDKSFNQSLLSTIGVDFKFRKITINNQEIKLQIWDTAGQQTFRSIVSAYYSSADAIIIVYDITSYDSFESIRDYWIDEVQNNNKNNAKIFLLGNKTDEQSKRQVQAFSLQSFIQEHQLSGSFEASAKTGQNVESSFEQIAKSLYFNKQAQKPVQKPYKKEKKIQKEQKVKLQKAYSKQIEQPVRHEQKQRERKYSQSKQQSYNNYQNYQNKEVKESKPVYSNPKTPEQNNNNNNRIKINQNQPNRPKNPNYNKSCCLK